MDAPRLPSPGRGGEDNAFLEKGNDVQYLNRIKYGFRYESIKCCIYEEEEEEDEISDI